MAFKEYLSTGRSNFSAFNDINGPDSSYTTSPTPNYVRNMPTSASGANSQGVSKSEDRNVFENILGFDDSVDNLFG